ncbi:MAG: NUDIX domain-containing protein [Candidatus Magasanikbacteria bacterium]|nr:NUDIX domain-containing protein [Candidatus Magasanikbacteria bacterium]
MTKPVEKKYKFAVIAVDPIIFSLIDNQLHVLLIKMKKDPYQDTWAAPGGLVGGDESLDEAVWRLTKDNTGIKDPHFEQLSTFGEVERDPFGRVVSVAYLTLLNADKVEIKTTQEYGEIRWFSVKRLPKLAYDHRDMVQAAVERLQERLLESNIVASLLAEEFTLTALQVVYETILGKKLDKRNFRKKILSLKILKKTGHQELFKANRPAELYKFVSKRVQPVEILG